MKSFDADVIVAGAGPTGAVAARTLALAGVDTLLVERAAFPRNKPCGGGLTSRVLHRFPWIEGPLSEISVHPISALRLEAPDGSAVDMRSKKPVGLLMRRIEFDHALVRAATAAGARLREHFEITQAEMTGEGVTLTSRDDRQLRAPIVVAADGVHSVIAKRLGVNAKWPRHKIAIDMMEETPMDTLRPDRPNEVWVSYAYHGLDGYAYIFPKTHHTNVGIGCLLAHFDDHVPQRPYELQQGFVDAMIDEGLLHGKSDRRCFTPYLLPIGGPLPRAWHGRVLFAGDAGGFVHGITAEGIYYGMVTGELAGQAIVRAGIGARADAVGRAYNRLWRSEIGAELRDSVYTQRYLFARHSRVNHVVRTCVKMPWVTQLILDYTEGSISYFEMRRRIFSRFPRTAFRFFRDLLSARGQRPVET